jgi:probable F420-dependent oxidoreductase
MRVIYQLRSADVHALASEAAWAESMGYDGIASNETAHDPFLPLVLAATATSRVTLETHVVIAFPRSPMVVAYAAHDLQRLSRGRFRLGLGTQVKGHIERRFSTRWEPPGPRLREYVQSLRAIWECWNNGHPLDYRGKYYQFSLMTPFFNPGPTGYPPLPVYTGAINPYNCRVAGEVADGLMLHSLTSPEYVRSVVQPNIARGAREAGRGPGGIGLSGGGFIITGPDAASLAVRKEEARRRIAFYASTRTYTPVLECHGFQDVGQRLYEMSVRGRWDDMPGMVGDDMLAAFTTAGVYEEIAGRIHERYGGLVDEVNLPAVSASQAEEARLKRAIRRIQEGD